MRRSFIAAAGLVFLVGPPAKADDPIGPAIRKVMVSVADSGLPASTYDPDAPIRHSHRPEPAPVDPKMVDAIRNGLSLSVSACFNVYTQNVSVPGQDARLERCIMSVMAGYGIARKLLDRKEVSDAERR